jgi:hypothetical protein
MRYLLIMITIFLVVALIAHAERPEMDGLVSSVRFKIDGVELSEPLWPEWQRWDFGEFQFAKIIDPASSLEIMASPVNTTCACELQMNAGIYTSLPPAVF